MKAILTQLESMPFVAPKREPLPGMSPLDLLAALAWALAQDDEHLSESERKEALKRRLQQQLAKNAAQAAAAHVARQARKRIVAEVLFKTATPHLAQTGVKVAATSAGIGAAVATSSAAGAATASLAAFSTAAPVVAPLAVAAGVGYGVKKICDWVFD